MARVCFRRAVAVGADTLLLDLGIVISVGNGRSYNLGHPPSNTMDIYASFVSYNVECLARRRLWDSECLLIGTSINNWQFLCLEYLHRRVH